MNSGINIQATSKTSPIISIVVNNYYLLVLKESSINVFNLLDYTAVQEIVLEKGDVASDIALCLENKEIKKDLKIAAEKVMVSVNVTSTPKKETLSKIIYLKAISADDQIQKLILMSNVVDAQKVFSQNVFPHDGNYEQKKEQFNVSAAWALFRNFEFERSMEFFSSANFDPRELLVMIPGLIEKKEGNFLSLKELIIQKGKPESFLPEATQALIKLMEEKRKYLAEKYDMSKEHKKMMQFAYPPSLSNEYFKMHNCSLDEVMELIDNSLIKLYLEQQHLRQIEIFFESAKNLKCNYKAMEAMLKEKIPNDKAFIAQVCLAFLYDKFGNYAESLAIWKTIGIEGTKETIDLACKETARLLPQMRDKKFIFEHARMVLLRKPDDGIRIFTENEALPKFISEDDIIKYLEELEKSRVFSKKNTSSI